MRPAASGGVVVRAPTSWVGIAVAAGVLPSGKGRTAPVHAPRVELGQGCAGLGLSIHTHTHTHTHIPDSVCLSLCLCLCLDVCVCVCVCVCMRVELGQGCAGLGLRILSHSLSLPDSDRQ